MSRYKRLEELKKQLENAPKSEPAPVMEEAPEVTGVDDWAATSYSEESEDETESD